MMHQPEGVGKTGLGRPPLQLEPEAGPHVAELPPLSEAQEVDLPQPAALFRGTPPRPVVESPRGRYSSLPWDGYFDEERDIAVEDSESTFHVYLAGTEGAVVFCLHGGGACGAQASQHDVSGILFPEHIGDCSQHLLCIRVISSLSFGLVAAKMKEKVRVVSLDLRGHGLTHTDNDSDLSAETLSSDVLSVIRAMYGADPPAIILIGHSMGGAIAVHVAAKRELPTLAGLVVVDVVEGTAMSSLIHMQKVLSNRQQHFPSVERAIEWSVKGGVLRNVDSARLSVPRTLKFDDQKHCFVWLTPLEKSEQYWKGWYEGLSDLFLSCPVPKLLLLAGTDRLDRPLTIGQMQGKFQMMVVRHTGHAIQEDVPDEFSNIVLSFISRNRIGAHGVELPFNLRPATRSL